MIDPKEMLGPNWKQQLRDEHTALLARDEEELSRLIQQRHDQLRAWTINQLHGLGFDVTRFTIETFVNAIQEPTLDYATATIDDISIRLSYDRGGHRLHFPTDCPDCGQARFSDPITDRPSLAAALAWLEDPPKHLCLNTEKAEQTPDTPKLPYERSSQQLLDALYAWFADPPPLARPGLSHTPPTTMYTHDTTPSQKTLRTLLRDRLTFVDAFLGRQLHAIRQIQADITEANPAFAEDIATYLHHAEQALATGQHIRDAFEHLDRTKPMFSETADAHRT